MLLLFNDLEYCPGSMLQDISTFHLVFIKRLFQMYQMWSSTHK